MTEEKPPEVAELACQGCGELVSVRIPFYGCVFCPSCIKSEGWYYADAPEFKPKGLWE